MRISSGTCGTLILAVLSGCGAPERRPNAADSSVIVRTPATAVIPPAVAPTPDTTPASGPLGAFAYADSTGARLLVLAQSRPDSVVQAACQSGMRARVRDAGHQPESDMDNGRQRASNFDRDQGDVFAVVGDAVEPDETCFLVTPALAALGTLQAVAVPADTTCPADAATWVSNARARRVIGCSRIGAIDSESNVLGVEFEPHGDSALASLVVTRGPEAAFLDFPAERGLEGDTWRVGDGGRFWPSAFRVLFVVRGYAGAVLAFTWIGEEGESLTLAVSDSSRNRLIPAIRSYRYLAPL